MTRLFFTLWMATFIVSVVTIVGFTPTAQPSPYIFNTTMIPQSSPPGAITERHVNKSVTVATCSDCRGLLQMTSNYPLCFIE